jgi:CRISPR-associated endonuclease/helicase Cas3
MAELSKDLVPIAHSAAHNGSLSDQYLRHINDMRCGAIARAASMLEHASEPRPELMEAVNAATTFHDLGKLDPHTQVQLRKGRSARLKWDHIDAGVAHLSQAQSWSAAWMVRGHHSPGLPNKRDHFGDGGFRLRGRRGKCEFAHERDRHEEQIHRTDELLFEYVKLHEAFLGRLDLRKVHPFHGLSLRLALSCLVDADHSDTAFFDSGVHPTPAAPPRWKERLSSLCAYVRSLKKGTTPEEVARSQRRADFFESCLTSDVASALVACEAPVGLGKTTAVTAYLLRRACDANSRRLIIVAPYTNILKQTADVLTRALVLPGERAKEIVVEHHHRADFDNSSDRELAVLWNAPVVVTTAVSFFETLSANDPATLRKLHAVPGSVVFIDESHAALPAKLWRQNWQWLCELADRWGCKFALASGSLARFWEDTQIVQERRHVPELLPLAQSKRNDEAERKRVTFRKASELVLTVADLVRLVREHRAPHLIILNTVQNAAVVAAELRSQKLDVLHISTALSPHDRARIIKRVQRKLRRGDTNWSLVGTSCLEAGLDFSFWTGFRERFGISSLLQTAGRINRNSEYDARGGGVVFDVALAGPGTTQHPAAAISADIVRESFENDRINHDKTADLVSWAMREEIERAGGLGVDALCSAENARNYQDVKELGKVIVADTRLVVVDRRIKRRLREQQPIGFRDLLQGSVQIWGNKILDLGLEVAPGREDIFLWSDAPKDYEPDFLGYMAGILRNQTFLSEGGAVF